MHSLVVSVSRAARRAILAAGCCALFTATASAQIVTHADTIPDFCASPSMTAVGNGAWSSPSTWSTGRVPAGNDIVSIPSGKTVTFDAVMPAAASCVGVAGTLTFSTTLNTKLWTGNLLVYVSGTLVVGQESSPIPAGVKAEIMIANRPLDLTLDPDQYGTGLISVGTVRMHGAVQNQAFVRLAQEPRIGNTTLQLSTAVTGWKPGDALVLPDTRHMRWNEVTNWHPTTPQWEELTIQSISSDGKTITLTKALQFDHLGARDITGAITFLPHVGNVSRNVLVHSEATFASGGTPGHVMFTDRADVDVRYAQFQELGRTTIQPLNNATNHIGRYSVHFHHLMGPTTPPASGYQFTFIGNAVSGGSAVNNKKWGVDVHGSHYGFLQQNVVYNYGGAGVATEDGSESFNVFDSNFVVRTAGTGDRVAVGTEGTGFWFKGPNNYVRNNVAADVWGDTAEAAYGFKYFAVQLGTINIPVGPGSDAMMPGGYVAKDGNNMPILEFTNNEVYSAAQGLTYWWINSMDPQPKPTAALSLIKNLKLWNVYNVGIYHYPSQNVTIDGLVVRGTDPDYAGCCGRAVYSADYAAKDITYTNADIQGMKIGISVSQVGMGLQTIQNSVLRNQTNIVIESIFSTNGTSWIPPRTIILRNVQFFPWTASNYTTIHLLWRTDAPPTTPDNILVYAYQGNPTDNFRVYYNEQATQNIAGGMAPCTTKRTAIDGIVCPIAAESGGTTAPRPVTNLRILP